jgi:hypothetical protein
MTGGWDCRVNDSGRELGRLKTIAVGSDGDLMDEGDWPEFVRGK